MRGIIRLAKLANHKLCKLYRISEQSTITKIKKVEAQPRTFCL